MDKIEGSVVPEWTRGMNCAVTVCDRNGLIIYMNDKSRETFGGEMLGQSLIPCHNDRSRSIIARMLETGASNCYTIEKRGVHKIIYQTPWRDADGEVAGLVEISMAVDPDIPHYVR